MASRPEIYDLPTQAPRGPSQGAVVFQPDPHLQRTHHAQHVEGEKHLDHDFMPVLPAAPGRRPFDARSACPRVGRFPFPR